MGVINMSELKPDWFVEMHMSVVRDFVISVHALNSDDGRALIEELRYSRAFHAGRPCTGNPELHSMLDAFAERVWDVVGPKYIETDFLPPMTRVALRAEVTGRESDRNLAHQLTQRWLAPVSKQPA